MVVVVVGKLSNMIMIIIEHIGTGAIKDGHESALVTDNTPGLVPACGGLSHVWSLEWAILGFI